MSVSSVAGVPLLYNFYMTPTVFHQFMTPILLLNYLGSFYYHASVVFSWASIFKSYFSKYVNKKYLFLYVETAKMDFLLIWLRCLKHPSFKFLQIPTHVINNEAVYQVGGALFLWNHFEMLSLNLQLTKIFYGRKFFFSWIEISSVWIFIKWLDLSVLNCKDIYSWLFVLPICHLRFIYKCNLSEAFFLRYFVTPLMLVDLSKVQKLSNDQVKFFIYQILRGLKVRSICEFWSLNLYLLFWHNIICYSVVIL